MKRLHLHVSVPEIDDPRVNLAISSHAHATGVDHVGIQVDRPDELGELASRLKSAGKTMFDQDATICCYAKSDKSWVTDPAGVRWETFYTHGEATAYGEEDAMPAASGVCCAPATAPKTACC